MPPQEACPRELIAQELGISINGVKQHIKKMQKDGTLRRLGGNRTGHWKVLKK
jgi:predicted transcriptional regulator